MKIVIPDDYPVVMAASAAYKRFAAEHPVDYYDTLPGAALLERISGAEAVVNIRSSTRFGAEVFATCPRMRLLSIWGTGTDNVDLEAARRHGVTVTNTPGVAAISIAEHCLMLTLAVARNILATDAAVRRGEWVKGNMVQLTGKTLGIVGLGAIGRRFAQIGAAIGMKVLAWTMNPDPSRGYEQTPLETLLRESDVVSLHLRLSDRTKGFLTAEHFAMMKSTAIFINTARGPVVDEAALLEALRSRRIAGAGLDVFDAEPLPAGHPVTALDNVVLTPHNAGITPETLESGLALSLENVTAYLAGKPQYVVS